MVEQINCGIYLIHNVIENKNYVGSSKNITNRFGQHRKSSNHTKGCRLLVDAYRSFPKESFSYNRLEECSEEMFEEKENFWIDKYDSRNPENGYNISRPGKRKRWGMKGVTNRPAIKNRKPVLSIDINNVVTEFESAQEASENTGVDYKKVFSILSYWSSVYSHEESKSKFRSAKGLIFIRKEEYIPEFDYINYEKERINKSTTERAMKRRGEVPLEIRTRSVVVEDVLTGEQKTFDKIIEAVNTLGLNKQKVYKCLSSEFKKYKTGGYFIKYL